MAVFASWKLASGPQIECVQLLGVVKSGLCWFFFAVKKDYFHIHILVLKILNLFTDTSSDAFVFVGLVTLQSSNCSIELFVDLCIFYTVAARFREDKV